MSACLIIAGEKSGEEHALSFLPALKRRLPALQLFGVGGDEMAREGVELLFHLKDFSSWGFSEVIGKIPFYLKAAKKLEMEVERRQAKVAIVIDFQDFNLRLAKRLAKKGVKVLYYVAPQAWAWKPWRAKSLAECAHTLYCILPFEKKWFTERGVPRVIGIQHPVALTYTEQTSNLPSRESIPENRPVRLLLLPGSRNFEVKLLLPEFMKAAKSLSKIKDIEIGFVRSSSVADELVSPYEVGIHRTWANEELSTALKWADIALAASGTVTLACALFEVPTVVCYRASLLNEFIFHTFLDYRGYISLANIVHEKEVFPELVQERSNSYEMDRALKRWVTNPSAYSQIKRELKRTSSLVAGDLSDVTSSMVEAFEGDANATR
jgi:lipid-A-disaccharide synthase